MDYKHHDLCRVCQSKLDITIIDLGVLPLSNSLGKSQFEVQSKYPLRVLLCRQCGLSQLSIVVNPELMFSHYVYRSQISQGYIDHCAQMAKTLQKEYGLTKDSFMIDIAGNDGTLLKEFRTEIGLKVLNIDPAVNLSSICKALNIPVITEFFDSVTANKVLHSSGQADLITATNVIAHVDNLNDFMAAVKMLLKPGGVFVAEFPYVLDLITNHEFDTIYFEHLSYMSVKPLKYLCAKAGLIITKVERFPIHGGSVRVHIVHDPAYYCIKLENEITVKDYFMFGEMTKDLIDNFELRFSELIANGFKVAGFAASAKGNVLLNCAGISWPMMEYIVDETPEKIGLYSPGLGIPVVSMSHFREFPPDYLVILSWNFAYEIIMKCIRYGYAGKFIIPIPEFKIINSHDITTKNSYSAEY